VLTAPSVSANMAASAATMSGQSRSMSSSGRISTVFQRPWSAGTCTVPAIPSRVRDLFCVPSMM
jgi:hypothetical protein